jgi:hypothetical protein
MSRKPKVEGRESSQTSKVSAPGSRPLTLARVYAFVFGLVLGLCLWKFGNPVVLDQKISTPVSWTEFWNYAWPPHWANWIFLPLAIAGVILILAGRPRWPASKWLWLMPMLWFGWQFFSASGTVDRALTATALWQFFGCIHRMFDLLLIGILAAFLFCLVKAVDQRLFEFPQSRQLLMEGEQSGWTNIPPQMLADMKEQNAVIHTNGADVVSPLLLQKLAGGRANGTLVYPNALAGAILLLFPISLALAFSTTRNLKSPIRFAVIALTIFLGGAALFWSGSKLGWLLALAVGCLYLFRLNGSRRGKWIALALLLFIGLGVFTIRFQHYFAAGATSVGARFDYWRAAVQTTIDHPLMGTGPGTFQRPYELLKSPDAEMARLTHNDYLEQFSDSGIAGGLFYLGWIVLALATISRNVWRADTVKFALFAGTLAWFAQGIGEFSLYIPALAWTAFTLLGCLSAQWSNHMDNSTGLD